jgi:hypothetical protein
MHAVKKIKSVHFSVSENLAICVLTVHLMMILRTETYIGILETPTSFLFRVIDVQNLFYKVTEAGCE